MKTREELLNEMDKFRRTLTSGQSKVLKSGLHQILAASTEEQLKCNYCHIKDDDEEMKLLWKITTHYVYCRYCPMCGRRLDTDEN